MRSFITAAIVILFATAASGINEQWFKFGDSTRTAVTGVKPGEWVASTPDSISDDTQILSIGCENYDVQINPDLDGNGTGGTALTWQIQHCPAPQSTLNTETLQDNACDDFSSVGAITGSGEIFGAALVFIKFKMDGAHADDPQVIVSCVGSSGSR